MLYINGGKCHYMCLGRNTESAIFYFNDQTYANNKEDTIKGIIIDNKLSLYSHIKGTMYKGSLKSSALSRIAPNLDLS